MKKVYAEAVTRFLADQGGSFRFYQRRWWNLKNGSWQRGAGRVELEQAIIGTLQAFFPDAYRKMNQPDMGAMCAFLAKRLETPSLPGAYRDPAQDADLFRPWLDPVADS